MQTKAHARNYGSVPRVLLSFAPPNEKKTILAFLGCVSLLKQTWAGGLRIKEPPAPAAVTVSALKLYCYVFREIEREW